MKPEIISKKLKAHTPKILGSENFSKYAVLLPLIQTEEGMSVVFEVRSMDLRRQPGEICFPGGRMDPDDLNEREAAIRETTEELGLSRADISGVSPLDYLISPFGMIIYPFAGFIDDADKIKPNPAEVSEIFAVPLSFFIDAKPEIYSIHFKAEPEENFPFEHVAGGKNYNWRMRHMEEYFYHFEGRIIWGLTARILAHFIAIMKEDGN
ncbi:CoA pyrophosphatase [Neobacillus notoginsengisoli]|uniref:CoA pyrophosphatase n=1 Tax=Neobacillus notoginsengisoli TaxID=1578198 RepID=A0A417YQH3_9BACI|nr:CoA pyrophosphatase [Neobacillus notoginsengisoli]RHW36352.1 CoA pyrophosphatase [Neobacillus notoginsengisoli]